MASSGGKLSGTLSFPVKVTTKNISLPVWPDALPDADHALTVTLSNLTGTGVSLVRATGTQRLLDPT